MKKLSCTLLVCLPLWAFAQQQDCETLADNARKHVEAHFSLGRMVGDTLDVYAAICDRI